MRYSRELSQKNKNIYEHFSVKNDKNLGSASLRGNLLVLIKNVVFVHLLILSNQNLDDTS